VVVLKEFVVEFNRQRLSGHLHLEISYSQLELCVLGVQPTDLSEQGLAPAPELKKDRYTPTTSLTSKFSDRRSSMEITFSLPSMVMSENEKKGGKEEGI
jgi:hypothetical protein